MEQPSKSTKKTTRSIILLIIVVIISGSVGYRFGFHLAEKHNAEDARAAAQIETLDT